MKRSKQMRTWGKKLVLAAAALVIAFGSSTIITGCKKSEPAKAPPAPKEANEPAKIPPPPPAK